MSLRHYQLCVSLAFLFVGGVMLALQSHVTLAKVKTLWEYCLQGEKDPFSMFNIFNIIQIYICKLDSFVKKCIFCHETRLKKGFPPACVDVCPQEALTFGKRKDLIKIGHQRIQTHPGRYLDHLYGENWLIVH